MQIRFIVPMRAEKASDPSVNRTTPGPSQEGSYTGWPIPLLGGVRGGPVPLLGGVRGGLVGARFMGRERRFGFRGFSFLSSFAIRHSDFRLLVSAVRVFPEYS